MKLKYYINIKILILILFSIIVSLMIIDNASASWADENLTYRTNVPIANGVRPYQFSLNLSNSTGTNNNTNIFCNGHCNANFTDIRFYLQNTTLIPYWIENNTTGRIWTNVTGNGSVQIYYDNSSYTSLSNGNATFIQWAGATSSEFMYPVQNRITNVAYETIAKQDNTNSNVWWGMATSMTDAPVDGQFSKLFSATFYSITYNNSVATTSFLSGYITHNQYYRIGFTRNETEMQSYINGTKFQSPITTNLPDEPMGIGMNFADANTGDQLFSFLRYYFTPEPQWVTWGVQETLYSNNYTNNLTQNFSVPVNTHIKFYYNGTVTDWTVNGVSQGVATSTFNYTPVSTGFADIRVVGATGAYGVWGITSTQILILSSSAIPSSIFKCGISTITAVVSNVGATSVSAILSSEKPVQPMIVGSGRITPETQTTVVPLSSSDGGITWTGIFGNDNTLLWGNRLLSINVTDGGTNIYSTNLSIFVYSDACTGTNITNYTQMPTGLGNYTRKIFNGQESNLLEFALYPWIQVWGYLFYFLVIGTIVAVIYLKTQQVTQPLVVGLVLLLVSAGTTVVPPTYRNAVVFIIALILAVIYYRVFTREN